MKTIGIIGGTGFVGSHLVNLLTSQGYNTIIFSRGKAKPSNNLLIQYAQFDYKKQLCDTSAFKKLDAVVNLAGAGVADKRWTKQRKEEIITSRVDNTLFLISVLKAHAPNCKTFVAASATGFYGPDKPGSKPFTEEATPFPDFLGTTCQQWEAATQAAQLLMRTVVLRFGIVLGKESGAFVEFIKPMSLGIMPILGSGKQMVSWIEVTDLANLIQYAITNEKVSGIYNAVTPNPVTHKQLMKTIAAIKGGIKIPVPVPALFLKILLGELSIEILKSCTVSAKKTLASGFVYRFPELPGAVKHILGKAT
jgi:uncharacterized protein (TIGR01777 family)